MQVLTVARWYPSHDSPGRGSFVSDLVAATTAAGVDSRVVSFDRVLVRGDPAARERTRARARAAYDRVTELDQIFQVPRSVGAPGVPVARLPTVLPSGVVEPATTLDAHLEALSPLVNRLVEQWRPDVIHAHTGLPDGIVAAQVGRQHGIPVVVTEHASTIETVLADRSAAARYATLLEPDVRLLAVSPSMAGRLAQLLGVAPDRIGILTNPVSVDEFPLSDHLAGRRRTPDSLLYVGSLGAHKDMDVLLQAFAMLRDRRPGLRLHVVGGDRKAGDRGRLEDLADELKISDDVRFDGWLDRAKVAEAMAGAAALVHPSPSETFGVVAAESVLSGLPVASRRSGGVPWVIELAGGFGAVADDDRPSSFAEAIEQVLDGGLPIGPEEARARLAAEVRTEVIATKALAHYAEMIRRSPQPARPGTGTAPDRTVPPAGPVPSLLVTTWRDQAEQLLPPLADGLRRRLVVVLPPGRQDAAADAVSRLGVRVVEARRRDVARTAWWQRGPLARSARPAKRSTPHQRLRAAVLRAAETARSGPEPVEAVAMDAAAAALVGRLDPARVRLAPGSMRWLADRWDAHAEHSDGEARPAQRAVAATYDAAAYWSRLHARQELSAVGQAALPAELNEWLYRALAGTVRRFVRGHHLLTGVEAVFDVGAGSGFWVRTWHELGVPTVDGCDLVPEAVTRLNGEFGARGDRFAAVDVGSDEGIAPGRQYGLVSVMNVLLHVTDDDAFRQALTNVARLVRPGGHLVLVEPALLDPSYERPMQHGQHSRARPLSAYRDPLLAAGLELRAVRGAVALANNPIEAGSVGAYRRYRRWWAWVSRTSKAKPRRIPLLGRLMLVLDRVALRVGAAPSSKLLLLRRPDESVVQSDPKG